MSGLRGFFTSDLHGRPSRYRSLVDAAITEVPEVILIGGDLLPFDRNWTGGSFIEEVMRPLEEWGVTEHLLDTYGGSDHVDFLLEGIPILDANQPVANYLPNYHASSDTLDKVPLRDLRLNAAVMATALLGVSDRQARIGHRMSRAEVEQHVQETGFSSYLVDEGIWDEFVAGTRGRALQTQGD